MTPKQKTYLKWLLTPEGQRHPRTEDELAASLKCQPSTLQRWYHLPEFQEAAEGEIRHRLAPHLWPVIQVLVQKAMEGDFRSIKMFLELCGHYPVLEKPEEASKDLPKLEYTIEDYNNAIKDAEGWEQKKFGHLDPTEWL